MDHHIRVETDSMGKGRALGFLRLLARSLRSLRYSFEILRGVSHLVVRRSCSRLAADDCASFRVNGIRNRDKSSFKVFIY